MIRWSRVDQIILQINREYIQISDRRLLLVTPDFRSFEALACDQCCQLQRCSASIIFLILVALCIWNRNNNKLNKYPSPDHFFCVYFLSTHPDHVFQGCSKNPQLEIKKVVAKNSYMHMVSSQIIEPRCSYISPRGNLNRHYHGFSMNPVRWKYHEQLITFRLWF